jgi:outer membrane lipoprotein SlyB|tara:strand:+ start:130 stop:564 length:435 start_codon:yes stop_codon:yes gene_type:complete
MKAFIITASLVSVALLTSGFSLISKYDVSIEDTFKEVTTQNPYTVEVCEEVTTTEGDVITGAIWGAIFGAVIGDAIDDENGRLPGAIIGAGIGAKTEEDKGTVTGTSIVCKEQTRYTAVQGIEYSYSTISFNYEGSQYEIKFIK